MLCWKVCCISLVVKISTNQVRLKIMFAKRFVLVLHLTLACIFHVCECSIMENSYAESYKIMS